jgi:hypothetical protein
MGDLSQAQPWLLGDLMAVGLILLLTLAEAIKARRKARLHRIAVRQRLRAEMLGQAVRRQRPRRQQNLLQQPSPTEKTSLPS